jgi:hypothetical protein
LQNKFDFEITDEEVKLIDEMMNDHMYSHQISNNINGMSCDTQCRRSALGIFIDRVPEDRKFIKVVRFMMVSPARLDPVELIVRSQNELDSDPNNHVWNHLTKIAEDDEERIVWIETQLRSDWSLDV